MRQALDFDGGQPHHLNQKGVQLLPEQIQELELNIARINQGTQLVFVNNLPQSQTSLKEK